MTQTHKHGDSMTEMARWDQFSENLKRLYNCLGGPKYKWIRPWGLSKIFLVLSQLFDTFWYFLILSGSKQRKLESTKKVPNGKH